MGKYNSRKRKTKKNIPAGIAHIHSTFNNTIVTITDLEGNVVSWASSGKQGVKGSKKRCSNTSMTATSCWKRCSSRRYEESKSRSKRLRLWKRSCN